MLWTLQRSRCWDTGRGLAERIALGHTTETLSYPYPTSALCNLTRFIDYLTNKMLLTCECGIAFVGLQGEGWLTELLYGVP